MSIVQSAGRCPPSKVQGELSATDLANWPLLARSAYRADQLPFAERSVGMAICYKFSSCGREALSRVAILQAPDGLQNPRETKAFAVKMRPGKWSNTTVQIGNNFAHTVRDKSQAVGSKKYSKDSVLMDFCKNGCFSIRNEWSPIRQSDLIEGSQKWRIPAHLACS